MPATHAINVDLAKVWETPEGKGFLRTLVWGDAVEVLGVTPKHVEVRIRRVVEQPDGSFRAVQASGYICPPKSSRIRPQDVVVPLAENRVLKVSFVDVQQGDGAVIESPRGKVVLLDGGDNQLFARYLAARYPGTSLDAPKDVDCIVVTHGDADHFAGLVEIHESESNAKRSKRLFLRPHRVYHNGLVKRPSKVDGKPVPETEMLGRTRVVAGRKVVVELEEDLLAVDDGKMNKPFLAWKAALGAYQKRAPIEFRRLAEGDDDAFAFLHDEGVAVEVLGPIETSVDGKPGLRFLGEPKGPPGGNAPRFGGYSASHTINGHSIVLRLAYGGFRFLFAGDLNEESQLDILTRSRDRLQADVFKVPHHGSADFSAGFLAAVAPVVSVVSSGDENARKEYIHPRATLMGALGRASRTAAPLVLVTELVAFFEEKGFVDPERHVMKDGEAVIENGKAVTRRGVGSRFYAFRRTAFGMVKVRTDGRRLLVCTDSGNVQLKEAY
ncbi:MAG TPA: MBL fold metallo-hydrolase, partial [Candidatus Thermoplasmatota archaeon]|nr:MBL fold metallo-hydrolase [Candidatus Thermoplasmatota archaeon]